VNSSATSWCGSPAIATEASQTKCAVPSPRIRSAQPPTLRGRRDEHRNIHHQPPQRRSPRRSPTTPADHHRPPRRVAGTSAPPLALRTLRRRHRRTQRRPLHDQLRRGRCRLRQHRRLLHRPGRRRRVPRENGRSDDARRVREARAGPHRRTDEQPGLGATRPNDVLERRAPVRPNRSEIPLVVDHNLEREVGVATNCSRWTGRTGRGSAPAPRSPTPHAG
jgi:hypothetical protein